MIDIGLLLVFLCGGSWLYAGVMLAFADRRWNRGRIVLFAVCAAFCGWLIGTRRTGSDAWQLAVLLLAAATFFLPLLLQRRVHDLLLKGRIRAARGWGLALSLLSGRAPSATLPAVERIYAAAAGGGEPALTGGAGGLARLFAAPTHRTFIENQINAWTALREYRSAVELYETNFGPGPGRAAPDAGLLYTMVIPYSEAGDLRSAARCLRRAEEMQDASNPADLRRFVAFVHVYAQAGRVYAFERLLDQNPGAAAALPPAYPRLWRGVALLRHGEPEVARGVLASALARARPGEEWIGRIAQRYLDLPAGEAVPAAHDAELAADLDAIETREAPPSAETWPPAVADWRPYVSWGLMAFCALAYLLTEAAGSSEDSLTLARFGANVPAMVHLGDWWRLISSIFLHVGPLHLLFNLYALYLFGPFVERLAGRWEMLVIFMVSGIGGSAASAWLGHAPLSVGASGAIFGLLGAATIIGLTFRQIPRHVRRVYLVNFLFIVGISLAQGHFDRHIDNLAHMGGMVAGALVGLALSPAGIENRRRLFFRAAGVAVTLVTVAALWSAGANAESGVYPRIPRMRTEISRRGGWSIEVPQYWLDVQLKFPKGLPPPPEVVFQDPLGATLQVIWGSQPAKISVGPNETRKEGGLTRIGNYEYEWLVVTRVEHEERVAEFAYQTTQSGRSYLLVLKCEERHLEAYKGLLQRLLEGFDIHYAAPERPMTPDAAV